MIQAIEVQVISKIITGREKEPDIVAVLMGYSPSLYFSSYLPEIQFIHSHKQQYGVIPSEFTFLAQFPDFNIVNVIEPLEYLQTKLREYRRYLLLLSTFNKIKDLGDGDVGAAWNFLSAQCDQAAMLEDHQPMDLVKDAQKRADQIVEFNKQQRIPTGFPELDKLMYGGLSTIEELVVMVARTNSGKAQPLTSKVLTPDGWVTMSDLKVGDTVVGRNNDNGKVVQIFPQGVIDYYRVQFDDGTSVECSGEHLWTVSNSTTRNINDDFPLVVTTDTIAKSIDLEYAIPLCGELDFGNNDVASRQAELAELEGIHNFWTTADLDRAIELWRSLGHWVIRYDFTHCEMIPIKTYKCITSVTYLGKTECQCILLNNQSHTYITDGFNVTHNTWVCTKMMESAQKNGFPVAYYSPEMQAAYLGTRFDTWRGNFENNRLFRGEYSEDYLNYIHALPKDNASAYVIEDKDFPDGVSVTTLSPFVKKHDIKLLIIDGISYMNDDRHAIRDQEKYKNIALGLFQLSKKYGCAVVLVMQANREVKNKDQKGESIPTLFNAEGSDQPGRIATQAFGIRQIFDRHILDIGLLKSRMANNTTPVFSYAWDINTGKMNYIESDESSTDHTAPAAQSSATSNSNSNMNIITPTLSFGSQPDSSDLSLIDDDDESLDIDF